MDGVHPTPSHAVSAEEDSNSPVLQNESFINTTQAIPAESVEPPSMYDSELTEQQAGTNGEAFMEHPPTKSVVERLVKIDDCRDQPHSHAGNDISTIPLLAPVPSHPAPVYNDDDDVHQRETFGSGSWKDGEGPGRNSPGDMSSPRQGLSSIRLAHFVLFFFRTTDLL